MTVARLGIQTILFGKRGGEDLPGVLADIKAAGYEGAEIGSRSDYTGAALKQLLDDHGLACCGFHAGYPTFTKPEETDRHASQLAEVGGKYLMCSGVEGWGNADRDSYLRAADVFNQTGERLKAHDVTFCYHNHNWEFYDLGNGEKGINLLLAHTNPALVKFCVDVYWVACGGLDPARFVRDHADRAVYFHYKDGTFDATTQKQLSFTELGRGQMDLPSVTAAVQALSAEWIVTEQDKTDGDPATSARVSAEYARNVLGI